MGGSMKYRTSIADRLAALKALPCEPRLNVTIVGAGMAGLVAALELKELGHTVGVIEATDRPGGRVRSWRPEGPTGAWHEFGAMRLPVAHDHTRHYIEKVGLSHKLRPFVTAQKEDDAYYFVQGRRFRMREAGKNIPGLYRLDYAIQSEIERIDGSGSPQDRPTVPGILLGRVFGPIMQRLTPADEEALLFEGPPTAMSRDLEHKTLGEALADALGTNTDAVTLAGVSTGLEVWWHKCLANFVREEILKDGPPLHELHGGLDQLPHALAERVGKENIQYRTAVVGIENQADGVCLTTRRTHPTEDAQPQFIPQGDATESRCDYVLVTVPFGVLRGLRLTGLSAPKMEAIRSLSYASSTKVLLYCKERRWEAEGIIGGATMSDTMLRATYYPSDHVPPDAIGFTAAADAQPTGETLFRINHPDPKVMAASFAESGQAQEAGVLVASYSWGQDARRMGSLSHEQRVETCLTVLEQIHPGIREDVIGTTSCFWDEQMWARGAFAMSQSNEIPRHFDQGRRAEGRLFFAGEHLSFNPGWIQGAVISSIDAVIDMLSSTKS